MRILIISQYFWPENFRINDLALGLKEKGHEVTILTGKPNYPKGKFYSGYSFFGKGIEYWNNIKIYRSSLIPRGKSGGFNLIINYFSFAIFSSFSVLFIKEKFDKVLVFQTSPVTVGIPAILAKLKFKAPIYFWVQDLWPASIEAASNLKNKFILNKINQLTVFIYKCSDIILVQSEGFISYILNQGVERKKIIYYPNFAEDFYKPMPRSLKLNQILPTGPILLFAGNIGVAQSVETIIKAANLIKGHIPELTWIFLGDGRFRSDAEKMIMDLGMENLFLFLGSYPATEMPQFFAHADALIVTLKNEEIFNLTIPSKIQSYMACGRPILGALSGEGQKLIKDAKVGFAVEAEDFESFAEIVFDFFRLPINERLEMGQNGRSFFLKQFERGLLIDQLVQIMQ